jgi:hypothetical protein
MNPHASPRCAGRLLMALAAMTCTILIAGCGSGGGPAIPNNQGFTNGSLNGTYIFASQGVDESGAPLFIAGALVSNGTTIQQGGTMDVVDPEVTSPPYAQPITSGNYSISPDGRGKISLTSSVGSFTFDVVLSSPQHGLVSEFDSNGTGSGTIDLQPTPITSLSQIQGPYALSLGGVDSSDNPFASVGGFSLDVNGNLSNGIQDFNDGAFPYLQLPISATTATLGTGTGPCSLTLATSVFGALTFDVYPIDGTHLKFIETDDTQFLAGDAFTQTGVSFPTGAMVFSMSGGIGDSIIFDGGLMTSTDGLGDFSNGLEDLNNTGNLSPEQLPFAGTPAGAAGVGGRVVVNLSGSFLPASQLVMYPSAGGLLMMESDTASVTLGAAYAQTDTAFATAQGYGLNLSGDNGGGPLNDIAQFNTSSPNINGILDENAYGVPSIYGLNLVGTYNPDEPPTGRGLIVVPSIGTETGFLDLEYYVVNASTIIFIEMDQEQGGIGTFGLQNSTQGGVKSQVLTLHPALRPRGALKHNWKRK